MTTKNKEDAISEIQRNVSFLTLLAAAQMIGAMIGFFISFFRFFFS